MFSWSISSPRLNVGCRRYRKINPLSLTAADLGAGWWGSCREREKKKREVPSIVSGAELMHACVQSPSPTQYTAKVEKKKKKETRETTITEAYPHEQSPHCVHERKAELERRCFTFDLKGGLWRGGAGGGLHLEINESPEV